MKFNEKDYEIPQVTLELGFEDQSYRNDGAAWMIHEGLRLGLWVCEERAEDRENFSMKRYTVVPVDDQFAPVMEAADKNTEVELLETESDEELRAFITSREGWNEADSIMGASELSGPFYQNTNPKFDASQKAREAKRYETLRGLMDEYLLYGVLDTLERICRENAARGGGTEFEEWTHNATLLNEAKNNLE